MIEKVNWMHDIILAESGRMSTLQLTNSSDKLIGWVGNYSPSFSIKHQYTQRDNIKSILNFIKAVKDRYAGVEVNINMLKAFGSQFQSNAVTDYLNNLSDKGMEWINRIIGSSSNYETYINLPNTIQYWLNTEASTDIPTFTVLFLPKVENEVVKDTTEQARKWMDIFGGESSPANPSDISQVAESAAQLGKKVGIDFKAGWYKYQSPNGYGPEGIDRNSPKDISGTFILQVDETYAFKDLLVNELKVSMSDKLIKPDNYMTPYPMWIKFEVSFIRSVQFMAQDIKEIFNLD